MISIDGIKYIKKVAELETTKMSGQFENGVLFIITKGNVIEWRKASDEFNPKDFKIGDKIDLNSISFKAIQKKKELHEITDEYSCKMKLSVFAEPIEDSEGNAAGVFSIVTPVVSPILKELKQTAPFLVKLFGSEAFIAITDIEKIIFVQASGEFNVSSLTEGTKINDEYVSYKAIKTKKFCREQVKNTAYGVPVSILSYPVCSESDKKEVIGAVTVILPDKNLEDLKGTASGIKDVLESISKSIQKFSKDASNIYSDQKKLDGEIKKVIDSSSEINEVSSFISRIAKKTKMLGMNAAIHASKAGEKGKSFGVISNEISKLSKESNSAVPKIKKLTDDINSEVKNSHNKSVSSLNSSKKQEDASNEIYKNVKDTIEVIDKISAMVERI